MTVKYTLYSYILILFSCISKFPIFVQLLKKYMLIMNSEYFASCVTIKLN